MAFRKFRQLVMVEQTLFALPFAYLGVLFAGGGSVLTWVWVTVAFAAARIAGMSFNRVIDADIDAKNPRTSGRLIPKGEVKRLNVWLLAIASSLVLIGASYMLNMLCFYLSFAAVILLFVYSYWKRFSSSSHFCLGMVEATAPIGGYLAVTGQFSLSSVILGFVIMMWITGLDIVYAMQDVDFDKKERLHSLPVFLGRKRALTVSTACYVLAMCALVWAGLLKANITFPYWIALAGVGMIFVYQQKLARSDHFTIVTKKIFRANLYVAAMLFLGTATSFIF
ncbi:MAG: 4-hydroxybenzoate octaprenyltransferase [Chloroflexi bacterium]|jgi:4-hydroxybenzoate polyprenyltransferase|nr:4-hydroxybenzoate octaprenyltransferase [Chloroflexota bacterium]MBT7080397.1 4-hydroxybenzoate octaprenyltransferase [Chloroflexota bacterium]MBT7289228.1 4-hydroxybenzoate octaprenyltransferase [Chloroflexota bacterium]